MAALNSILSMGNGALSGAQSAIQTTGNNIANVNTPGYSRQKVRFETWPSLNYRPGQMGQGVRAAEVMRYFDRFIERGFLNKYSELTRWDAQSTQMNGVEAIFNETNGLGIGKSYQEFIKSWEKLSQFPDDLATRSALSTYSQNLGKIINSASDSMNKSIERVDDMLTKQVSDANKLIKEIASLNASITAYNVEGENNANSMLDERDRKVRELAKLIDVDVIDRGSGDYRLSTKAGHTLVEGPASFSLDYKTAGVIKEPGPSTVFDGELNFNGSDGYEYTIDFVTAGTLTAEDAQFRVSLDGGRTWITNEDGSVKLFNAVGANSPVRVKNLDISFSHNLNDNFNVGDRFTIVPKNALYWIEPTMGPMLISPQVFPDGTDNRNRVIGGEIGGNLFYRDYQAMEIKNQLDDYTRSIIWEVNRIHSQGAGSTHHSILRGEYTVHDPSIPIGANNSGLIWNEKLQSGNFSVAIYDPNTGAPLLFDPGIQAAISINFNPETDSLNDLVNNINNTMVTIPDANNNPVTVPLSNYINASVVGNSLQIDGVGGHKFGISDDTTGVLAGFGLNTFFKGKNADTIAVREEIVQDNNRINAGRVNGAGELNPSDGIIARDIGALATKQITFSDWTGRTSTQSINNFYNALISEIGGQTASVKFFANSTRVVASELEDRQSEVAGVNLDEEMSSLIRYQSSYKAAAKLITTADQMLQTLLGLKQ